MRLPMYEVRRRQTGAAHVRCTMYDVRLRCSRALRGDAKLVRRDVKLVRRDVMKLCTDVVTKERWQTRGGCLCTMDDGGA